MRALVNAPSSVAFPLLVAAVAKRLRAVNLTPNVPSLSGTAKDQEHGKRATAALTNLVRAEGE
jgi:hypothetical protein